MLWLVWVGGILILAIYIFCRLTCGINTSSTCLIGKTALVTGANSGIGYQVALQLASRGCRVVMADVADMEVSKSNIIKYTNNPNISTMKLDLASFKSVRLFASEFLKQEDSLHILINNAGVGASKLSRTEDGLNPVMQINYFGPFLLTHLLTGILKKSAPSRIVFTSSIMAFLNNLNVENLSCSKTVGLIARFRLYANSKLAVLIAADGFAEKLRGTGVTSNSVHPGLVNTAFHKKSYSVEQIFGLEYFMAPSIQMFSKNDWEGAQCSMHVAVSKEEKETTGKHFWDCKPFLKPLSAYRAHFCKDIWDASERYAGLTAEEKL